MIYVPSFRIINTKIIIKCTVLFGWTNYALYHAKKDPGFITKPTKSALAETYSLELSENETISQHSTRQSHDVADRQSQNPNGISPTYNAFTQDVEKGQGEDMSQVGCITQSLFEELLFCVDTCVMYNVRLLAVCVQGVNFLQNNDLL